MRSADHKLAVAQKAVADVLADPAVCKAHKAALRPALGTIAGVALIRRNNPAVIDFRERQTPVGDRDGGCGDDDAA